MITFPDTQYVHVPGSDHVLPLRLPYSRTRYRLASIIARSWGPKGECHKTSKRSWVAFDINEQIDMTSPGPTMEVDTAASYAHPRRLHQLPTFFRTGH